MHATRRWLPYLALLLAPLARAGDGRKPVYLPASGALPIPINTPGSYYLTEDINVNSTSNVISITADRVTLDLDGHNITNSDTTTSKLITAPNKTSIRVTNGTLAGGRTGIDLGDDVGYASDFRIDNLFISGTGSYAINVSGSCAFTCGTPTATIEHNTIRSPGAYGIYYVNALNGLIRDNLVRSAGTAGIYVDSNSVAIAENTVEGGATGIWVNGTSSVRVERNTVNNVSSYGIRMVSVASASIQGNNVSSCGLSGIYLAGSNNIIQDDTSGSNADHGLYIDSGSYNVVEGGSFSGNSKYGILLEGDRTTIARTSVAGNGQDGLVLNGTSIYDTIQYNSILANNGIGVNLVGADYCTVDWNAVLANNVCGIQLNSTSQNNTVTYNRTQMATACGTNGISNQGGATNIVQNNLP